METIEQLNKTIKIQEELIEILKTQVIDLSMMSKIELGDDVIKKLNELNSILNRTKH